MHKYLAIDINYVEIMEIHKTRDPRTYKFQGSGV